MTSLFAWYTRMTLFSIPDDALKANASELINAMNVTHLHLTPALASRLTPEQIPGVQLLLTSGELLTAKVHKEWAGKGLFQGMLIPKRKVHCSSKPLIGCAGYKSPNLNGLFTICHNLDRSTSLGSIGKPLMDTSAMIMAGGSKSGLLPRGALGELCFGSDQLVRFAEPSDLCLRLTLRLGTRCFRDRGH